jgi:hypothetical protein
LKKKKFKKKKKISRKNYLYFFEVFFNIKIFNKLKKKEFLFLLYFIKLKKWIKKKLKEKDNKKYYKDLKITHFLVEIFKKNKKMTH